MLRQRDFDNAAVPGYAAYYLSGGQPDLGALAVAGGAEGDAVVGNLKAGAAGDDLDRLSLDDGRRQAQVAAGHGAVGGEGHPCGLTDGPLASGQIVAPGDVRLESGELTAQANHGVGARQRTPTDTRPQARTPAGRKASSWRQGCSALSAAKSPTWMLTSPGRLRVCRLRKRPISACTGAGS